jgi:predicted Zn finger-like uncharacterized protein
MPRNVETPPEIGRAWVVSLVRLCAKTIAICDMIIACPACGTRYAVPDAAIGSEGRTVRCAKCKHSWFQDPPVLDLVAPAEPSALAAQSSPPAPPPAAATPDAYVSAPLPAPETASDGPSISHWRTPDTVSSPVDKDEDTSLAVRALRRGLSQGQPGEEDGRVIPRTDPPAALAEPDAPEYGDTKPPFDDEDEADEGSQFGYSAPFTRRRNTIKMWTFAAAIFAVLATGTIAAVNYYGLPDWVPLSRPTFGIGQPGLELEFPQTEQRPETLENGETIFRVRGTIANTARETLNVPNLLVVFSDAREREVGDWVVVPAKRRLAPGETVTVTEAIANIPPGAAVADLGWAPN